MSMTVIRLTGQRNRLAAYTEEQSAFLPETEATGDKNVGRHEDHDT